MPRDAVTVHVNRDEPGSLEVDADPLETRDSFDVRLENHGDPVHVHCRLSETLVRVASVDGVNHYVGHEQVVTVPVSVESGVDDLAGTIEVATGFGAYTASIPVTILGGPRPVDVDERLASPPPREPEPDEPTPSARSAFESLGLRLTPGTVGVLVLATLALVIAIAAAAVVGGVTAFAAVAVVGGGILVALALLIR